LGGNGCGDGRLWQKYAEGTGRTGTVGKFVLGKLVLANLHLAKYHISHMMSYNECVDLVAQLH